MKMSAACCVLLVRTPPCSHACAVFGLDGRPLKILPHVCALPRLHIRPLSVSSHVGMPSRLLRGHTADEVVVHAWPFSPHELVAPISSFKLPSWCAASHWPHVLHRYLALISSNHRQQKRRYGLNLYHRAPRLKSQGRPVARHANSHLKWPNFL
jgi:hypothetical protein